MNLEHFEKLIEVYGTADAEEILAAMKEDVHTIKKAIKSHNKRESSTGFLNFARIGSDNWK